MRLVKQFICCSIIVVLFSNASIECGIETYITHDPKIVLLADDHVLYPQAIFDSLGLARRKQAEISDLQQLLRQMSEKKGPCIVLAEDLLATAHKKLRSLDADIAETSLLRGLAQRIEALQLANLRAINLDRGVVLRNAIYITDWYENYTMRPRFEGSDPAKIEVDYPNAHSLRFSDIIDEVQQIKRQLLARHSPAYNEVVHSYIDSWAAKIDERLIQLQTILANQQVGASAGIMATTVRWWILSKMLAHPDKIAEFQSLGRALEEFGIDYKKGLSKQEWIERTVDLRDRCRQLLQEEPRPIIQKKSISSKFFGCLAGMVAAKNWLSRKQEVAPEPAGIELTALSDPSRNFHNQLGVLNTCLWNLRCLVVDSHAMLDILDHPEAEKIVVAGADHIENMSQYLSAFGFARTNRIVRDRAINGDRLDLNALTV